MSIFNTAKNYFYYSASLFEYYNLYPFDSFIYLSYKNSLHIIICHKNNSYIYLYLIEMKIKFELILLI